MDFLASYVTDLVLYRSGDAMPRQFESPTQNQKEWKKVGISNTFLQKKNTKTKNNTNLPEGKPSLC